MGEQHNRGSRLGRLRRAALSAALFLAMSGLAGCGAGVPDDQAVHLEEQPASRVDQPLSRASAVVLTSPRAYVGASRFGAWSWRTGDAGTRIRFSRVVSGVLTASELTPNGAALLWVASRKVAGTRYLLVSVWEGLPGEASRVSRFHDTSGDGAPDADSEVVLFSTGATPAYVSAVAFDGSDAYLLDVRCADVLRVTDSDADGWPDTVADRPFAQSAVHVELVALRGLTAVAGTVRAWQATTDRGRYATARKRKRLPRFEMRDTVGDGVADVAVFSEGYQGFHPSPTVRPYQGQVVLPCVAPSLESFGVWRLDASGAKWAKLGSGVGAGLQTPIDLTLLSPLVKGETIEFKGATSVTRYPVVADTAQPLRVSPLLCVVGTSRTLRLTGVNLDPAMTLELRVHGQVARVLPFTFVSSTAVDVQVPALPDGSEGSGGIYALDPDAGPSDVAWFVGFAVAAAP